MFTFFTNWIVTFIWLNLPSDVCIVCLFAATVVSIREEVGSRKICCSGSGLPDYVQYPFVIISFLYFRSGIINTDFSLYVLGKVQLLKSAANIYFIFLCSWRFLRNLLYSSGDKQLLIEDVYSIITALGLLELYHILSFVGGKNSKSLLFFCAIRGSIEI